MQKERLSLGEVCLYVSGSEQQALFSQSCCHQTMEMQGMEMKSDAQEWRKMASSPSEIWRPSICCDKTFVCPYRTNKERLGQGICPRPHLVTNSSNPTDVDWEWIYYWGQFTLMGNKPVPAKHLCEGVERASPWSCIELWFAGQWSTDEMVMRWKCTWDLPKRFLTDPWSRKFTAGGLKAIFHQDNTVLHKAVREDPARDTEQKWDRKKMLRLSPGGKKEKNIWFWRVEPRGSERTQPPKGSC